MKLRNKETGEIIKINNFNAFIHTDEETKIYTSLAELNEEWEDYKELKDFWFIDDEGGVECGCIEFEENLNLMQQIGNYFETKEEAEKAVEKLKAWERLKDKGFRFEGIAGLGNEIYFKSNEPFNHIMVDEYTTDKTEKEYIDDLMILFGGNE